MNKVESWINDHLDKIGDWVGDNEGKYYLYCFITMGVVCLVLVPFMEASIKYKIFLLTGGTLSLGYMLAIILFVLYFLIRMLMFTFFHPIKALFRFAIILKYLLYIAIAFGVLYLLNYLTGGLLGALAGIILQLIGE